MRMSSNRRRRGPAPRGRRGRRRQLRGSPPSAGGEGAARGSLGRASGGGPLPDRPAPLSGASTGPRPAGSQGRAAASRAGPSGTGTAAGERVTGGTRTCSGSFCVFTALSRARGPTPHHPVGGGALQARPGPQLRGGRAPGPAILRGGGGGALSSRLLGYDPRAPLRIPRAYSVFVAAGRAALCPVPCAPAGPFALRPVLWTRPPPPYPVPPRTERRGGAATRTDGGSGAAVQMEDTRRGTTTTRGRPGPRGEDPPPPPPSPRAAKATLRPGTRHRLGTSRSTVAAAERALLRSVVGNRWCSSCRSVGAALCPLRG